MNNTRKQYSQEFKQGAVDLVKSGKSIASVARDLGVTTTSIRHWVNQEAKSNTDDYVRIKELEAEIKKLNKEMKDKDETIEILKKATAIFSK